MAVTLTHINPIYLDAVWPKVVGLLSSAVAKAKGEITLDQLRYQVLSGRAHLLVTEDSGEVVSAATVEFVNYPNFRVAYCSFMAGSTGSGQFEALKNWAVEQGASRIDCWTDDATARLFSRFGFAKQYNVLRVEL